MVDEITLNGGKAVATQADATDAEQVEKMMEIVSRTSGDPDILVINAGMHFKVAPFMQLTWEDFSRKYYGEMKSFYNTSKAVIPGMIVKKQGCNCSSFKRLIKASGHGLLITQCLQIGH